MSNAYRTLSLGLLAASLIAGMAQAADPAPAGQPKRALDIEAHRGGRAQHILPLQQPADPGLAHRERAEHQGAMADGFITRNGEGPHKRGNRAGGAERLENVHDGRALSTSALPWHDPV